MLLTPPSISRLAPLAENYNALLCDAWGVIHNGVDLFDGAAEAMINFRANHGPVIILTNAPRPASIIPAQLDRLGLPRDAYDAVVTSGDATRAEIVARGSAAGFRLGPQKDDALYDGIDVEFTSLEEAAFIICTGLIDDGRETPEEYRPLLESAAARNLPMICANPDKVVRWGGRLIYCAGALAEIYEQLGGDVIYGGKPHAPIYDLAMTRVAELAGAPVETSRTLAIGDGLHTDIAGANAKDIDAVYVFGAGGVHDANEETASEALKRAGAFAVATMERLQW